MGKRGVDSQSRQDVSPAVDNGSAMRSKSSTNMTGEKIARSIRAILFDKDGTLVDFQRTWGPAVHAVMQTLAAGRRAIYERLATASGFIESELRFLPNSLLIGQATNVWGPLWAEVLGCEAGPHFFAEVNQRLCEATTSCLVPIGEPKKLMMTLAGRGYRLGIISNDAEITVRAHAAKLGIDQIVEFIAGYDSGFGAKPDPGPILAFVNAARVHPSEAAVVGDTTLDLAAARAAGAIAIGVLTGPASAVSLAPDADVIIASAGELLRWLDKR
jgi:phosphoglycolate phosphatase